MKTLHIIVRGKVQGVGYRATVEHFARKLGIHGSVKNLINGSVELYAQGTPERLVEFNELIQQSRGLAKVEHVSVEECSIQKNYEDFQIIF